MNNSADYGYVVLYCYNKKYWPLLNIDIAATRTLIFMDQKMGNVN